MTDPEPGDVVLWEGSTGAQPLTRWWPVPVPVPADGQVQLCGDPAPRVYVWRRREAGQPDDGQVLVWVPAGRVLHVTITRPPP